MPLNKKLSMSVFCPECNNGVGKFVKLPNAKVYSCDQCRFILRCVHCGGSGELSFANSARKAIYCNTCRLNFWSKSYDKPNKKNVLQIGCAYCGLEDEDCPYCLINNTDERQLITDSSVVQTLASLLFRLCPRCHSRKTNASLDGMKCNNCGCKWRPDKIDDDQLQKFNLNITSKQLCEVCEAGFVHNGKCDRCGEKDSNICPKCGDKYLIKSQIGGACYKCRESVKAVECGNKEWWANSKKVNPFSTKAVNDQVVVFSQCPDCHFPNDIGNSDLFCKCSICESLYSVDLKSVNINVDEKESVNQFDAEIFEQFERFTNTKSDIDNSLDDLMNLILQIRDMVNQHLDPTEEINGLENSVEALQDFVNYIEDGDDEDDSVDDEDVFEWKEDDEPWKGSFERYHLLGRDVHYNDVLVTDAGNEFNDFDDIDTELENDCEYCGGELNPYSVCRNCLMKNIC